MSSQSSLHISFLNFSVSTASRMAKRISQICRACCKIQKSVCNPATRHRFSRSACSAIKKTMTRIIMQDISAVTMIKTIDLPWPVWKIIRACDFIVRQVMTAACCSSQRQLTDGSSTTLQSFNKATEENKNDWQRDTDDTNDSRISSKTFLFLKLLDKGGPAVSGEVKKIPIDLLIKVNLMIKKEDSSKKFSDSIIFTWQSIGSDSIKLKSENDFIELKLSWIKKTEANSDPEFRWKKQCQSRLIMQKN